MRGFTGKERHNVTGIYECFGVVVGVVSWWVGSVAHAGIQWDHDSWNFTANKRGAVHIQIQLQVTAHVKYKGYLLLQAAGQSCQLAINVSGFISATYILKPVTTIQQFRNLDGGNNHSVPT